MITRKDLKYYQNLESIKVSCLSCGWAFSNTWFIGHKRRQQESPITSLKCKRCDSINLIKFKANGDILQAEDYAPSKVQKAKPDRGDKSFWNDHNKMEWLYMFISSFDGGHIKARLHITEENSRHSMVEFENVFTGYKFELSFVDIRSLALASQQASYKLSNKMKGIE